MRWFRRHRTKPTEMERRVILRPADCERELATWLEKHPEFDDTGPAKQLTQWLRETWEDGVSGWAPGRLRDGTTPSYDRAQDDWPDGPCQGGSLKPWLPERLVRGLVALLATPFLLLAMLVIGCLLKTSGKLTEARISSADDWPIDSHRRPPEPTPSPDGSAPSSSGVLPAAGAAEPNPAEPEPKRV
jgi:hypothetical protein